MRLNLLNVSPIGSMRTLMLWSRSLPVSRSTSSATNINSGSPVPAGQCAQARLHGHQFAHDVDELVQLFGRHPDGGGASARRRRCCCSASAA